MNETTLGASLVMLAILLGVMGASINKVMTLSDVDKYGCEAVFGMEEDE